MRHLLYFARFKIQFKERAIILTFGAGLCSIEDTDICLVYENVIEDAVFPLPTVLENATLVMPKGRFAALSLSLSLSYFI